MHEPLIALMAIISTQAAVALTAAWVGNRLEGWVRKERSE